MTQRQTETGSRQNGQSKAKWQKPRLDRLGTIADIAQGPLPLNQAHNDKRS